MNLILCGLPFVGKTSIGKKIAEKWGRVFIDLDRSIEAHYLEMTGLSRSCKEIYLEMGETHFRAMESDVIDALKNVEESVIALGGGSLLEAKNVAKVQALGYLIYLKSDLEELWKRVSQGQLPAYLSKEDPKGSFYEMALKRIPLYGAASNCEIEVDAIHIDPIITKIEEWIHRHGK